MRNNMQINHKARRGRTFHCCLGQCFLETDSWDGDYVQEASRGVSWEAVPQWEWGKQPWIEGKLGLMQVQLKPQSVSGPTLELGWSFWDVPNWAKGAESLYATRPHPHLTIQSLHKATALPEDTPREGLNCELSPAGIPNSWGNGYSSLEGRIQKHIHYNSVWFKAKNYGAESYNRLLIFHSLLSAPDSPLKW